MKSPFLVDWTVWASDWLNDRLGLVPRKGQERKCRSLIYPIQQRWCSSYSSRAMKEKRYGSDSTFDSWQITEISSVLQS